MHPNANVHAHRDTYMLFSCHQPEFMTAMLKANNIGFEDAIGFYKGAKEPTFIVNRKHFEFIARVLKGDQESILLLDEVQKNGARKATLLDLASGRVVDFGLFKPVELADIEGAEGWTYRPDQDQYYACVV